MRLLCACVCGSYRLPPLIAFVCPFPHRCRYLLNVNWQALVQDYVNAGGQAMNIIEPVDGFHPSQVSQRRRRLHTRSH